MIVPIGVVSAQENTDNANTEFNPPDFEDFTDDSVKGPVGIVDELNAAHNLVTNIMIGDPTVITNENLSVDDIYLQAVYVDEENEKLVIWLDPYYLFDTIDVEDLKDDLFMDVPVEIKYGFFMPETHTTLAPTMPSSSPLHCPVSHSAKCYIWDRYVQNCTSGNTASYCSSYGSLLRGWGLTPPTSTPTTPTTPTPTLPDGVVFQDDFENGFGQWSQTGQREWLIGSPDDIRLPGYPSNNKVVKADDCDDEACIITMSSAVDLSSYSSATLEFDRFVDIGLDTREYLKVQVGNNDRYTDVFYWTHRNGDDHTWHHETLDLSSYLSSGFKIKILTEQSSSREDVAIDNIVINVESVSACVITVNSQLQSSGAIRTSWNDCGDDYDRYNVYVSKNGGSDRLFRVTSDNSYTLSNTNEGSSYVMKVKARVASDRSSYTELFSGPTVSVPVVDRTAPVIMASAGYTIAATSAQGVTMTFPATAHDAVDGIVSVTCNPPSGSMFPVGHTTVRCTATDAAGNTATKNIRIHVEAYVEPDADGDGFADNVDQCPNQASSTNNGCPVVPPVVPPTNSTIPTNGTSTIPVNGTTNITYQCITNDGVSESDLFCGINETLFTGKVIGGEIIFLEGTSYNYITRTTDRIGTYSTMGLITNNSDSETGILVSSHWTGDLRIQNIDRIFSKGLLQTKQILGDITQDTYVYSNRTGLSADVAFITITNPDVISHMHKIQQGFVEYNVTSFGGFNDLSRNSQIEIAGIYNDGVGELSFYNATVIMGSIANPYTLINQVLGTYPSINGDSGSPIFVNTGNNTAQLLGLHVGKSCNIIQADLSSVVHIPCDSDSPDSEVNYKVFSPWENIIQELNME